MIDRVQPAAPAAARGIVPTGARAGGPGPAAPAEDAAVLLELSPAARARAFRTHAGDPARQARALDPLLEAGQRATDAFGRRVAANAAAGRTFGGAVRETVLDLIAEGSGRPAEGKPQPFWHRVVRRLFG